jgi:carboxypeptidase Q
MLRRLIFVVTAAAIGATRPSPAAAQETIDPAMMARIRDEGLNRSRAWPMLDTLATVIGPRLTASPAYMRAATWVRDHLTGWGLKDVHMESWPFGRGWELQRFALEMTAPRFAPIRTRGRRQRTATSLERRS